MPTKIQTPDPGGQLKSAYGIKGRLPLVLDEVIVPVHIIGEGNPQEVSLNPISPNGSTPYVRFVVTTGSGAGNFKAILVQLNDLTSTGTPVEPRNVLIERLVVRGSNTLLHMGIGLLGTKPTGFGTVNQLFRRNRAGGDPSIFSQRIIARGFNVPNGSFPSAQMERIDTTAPRVVDVNWMLGTQFSVGDTDGLPGERTADNTLIQGNREFWVMGDALNDNLEITVYASVMPASAEV